MRALTTAGYRDLCALAGAALDRPRPVVQEAGALCGSAVAVYLLGHRDPVTNGFVVDYVGSAVRPSSDVRVRVREHLRDARKRARFTHQVLLPLDPTTSASGVRRLEGEVARALGVPRWCIRVPGGKQRQHQSAAVR